MVTGARRSGSTGRHESPCRTRPRGRASGAFADHDAKMSEERPRRLSESSRVEAFSDGVFSIAITLLVLELAVPATRDGFGSQLLDEWISYVAYLAGFGSI